MNAERQLQRAVEDAHAKVKHYRAILSLIVTVFVVSVVVGVWGIVLGSLSVGTGVDVGLITFLCVGFGVVVGGSSWFMGAWWWELHHMETRPWDKEAQRGGGQFYAGPVTRHLTAAQRAHEDYTYALANEA